MLKEQTLNQLKSLRLDGMVAALTDQAINGTAAELGFDARVAMLVQREIDWRDDKRLTRLLKAARLKVSGACIEDIKWRASRNLDRHLIASLASCDWVRHARTVLMTGSTGTGKTWLSCALAQQAARSGLTVLYTRTTRLMQELHVAHGDGSFGRRLAQLARIDLLVLDDFAGAPMKAGERTDLLELLDMSGKRRQAKLAGACPLDGKLAGACPLDGNAKGLPTFGQRRRCAKIGGVRTLGPMLQRFRRRAVHRCARSRLCIHFAGACQFRPREERAQRT